MLLKKLCETHAVSGDEARVRQIILDNIKPYADEITIDIMGNMIALKKLKFLVSIFFILDLFKKSILKNSI